MTPARFTHKVCLVTGGGSGIGRAASLRFGAEGGRVAVLDIVEERAQRTAAEVVAAGGEAVGIGADVSQSGAIRESVGRVVRVWGRLDVIVNDAATMTFTEAVETDEDDFDRVLAVNLRSVFLLVKYGVPHMGEGSAVVNVSSVHAHQTTANVAAYAASKGGMEAMTRALSIELAPRSIRINCVAPGAVDTPMLWNNPNIKSGVEKVTDPVGKPEDIAAAIAFLAAAESRFTSGTTLVVDGGRLARL